MNNTIKFPQIMGILNITPDSFSDGGKFSEKDAAIRHAEEMINDGADIIDIGGESTRPNAESVSEDEELSRVIPIVESLHKLHPQVKLSVDTTKSKVAEEAIKAGASIINDISGLSFDPTIADVCAKYNKELVIMHIKGEPRTMQANPQYDDLISEVYSFLEEKIAYAKSRGVSKIYADIGIGFGKTVEHNIELLKNAEKFNELGVPQLLGISRKSFIGKLLDIDSPENRDCPTVYIHALLLNKNIEIIRVHNVKLHSQLRTIYNTLF